MPKLVWLFSLLVLLLPGCVPPSPENATVANADRPYNIIFILSDDHRYDFMGFTGKVPWLETPAMDRMAREGAHLKHAFVTTSLCSPSRASILTGLYSHQHTIVDNEAPNPGDLTYFPEYLQEAGYATAFIGKWHMGAHHADPRPGFDHWVSFRGQGTYFDPDINKNGEEIDLPDTTYMTDYLAREALDWLEERETEEQPFFLYLSHKAVHAEFMPAPRHRGIYADKPLVYPPSYYLTDPARGKSRSSLEGVPNENYTYNYGEGRLPDWVKEQRVSWHGVDYMYHGQHDFASFFRAYCETLLALDESVGQVLDFVDRSRFRENTVVIYMGDNGFSFGEHGLIDKRHSYEESIKVPMLAYGPGLVEGGLEIEQMVQNVDIAPTVLDLAGVAPPGRLVGRSMVPLLRGEDPPDWRQRIYYEYFWEEAFPQTPTQFAVRTDRYKYIRYHGIWDTNEFYDLEADPYEMNNLINDPSYRDTILALRNDLYDWLEATGGLRIPLKRKRGGKLDYRNRRQY